MNRLAAVIYSTGNPAWAEVAVKYAKRTSDPELTAIVSVDNGSAEPFPKFGDLHIRYDENVGGNAIFHRWKKDDWFKPDPDRTLPDIIAFFHCDLFIHEEGWDQRVIDAFDADPKLDLVGFVGSTEIDSSGGRGAGTMLNYAGRLIPELGLQGSPARHHGRTTTTLEAAAVLDHAAMIFRRTTLEELKPQEGHYAPEHFYDRLLSCEVTERGGRIAVLGISVDHFSGGIAGGMPQADALRRKWLDAEGIAYNPADSYTAVYLESERRFFARYAGFFPYWVRPDYSVGRARR